jgi:catechol 2,3-dioxygenase-like lactoylglutathione lyase family enzyme
MLEGVPIMAMLPASDLDRARRWYEEKLGLRPAQELAEQEILVYDGFLVYRSQFAGTAKNTAAVWLVEPGSPIFDELRERGVRFEQYDMPELTWRDGVATGPGDTRAAWFTDSEGSILSITEVPAQLRES